MCVRSKLSSTCSSQNQSDVISCGPVRAPHCAKNEVEERGRRGEEKVAVSEIPSPCTNLGWELLVAVAWSVGRLLNNKKEERRVNNGERSGDRGDNAEHGRTRVSECATYAEKRSSPSQNPCQNTCSARSLSGRRSHPSQSPIRRSCRHPCRRPATFLSPGKVPRMKNREKEIA